MTTREYTRADSIDLNDTKEEKNIEIIKERFMRGPNVHALFPVVEITLDLGDWVDTPSDPDFADKLVSLIPELEEHTCSRGYKGGFIERLHEGTYPAHIIEHCIIAIQNSVGSKVSFGKSRRKEDSIYKIIVEYDYENVVLEALDSAVEIVNGLLNGSDFELLEETIKETYEEAKYKLEDEKLGPSTAAIIDEANKRDIPYKRINPDFSLFSLGWGKNKKMIWGPVTSDTSLLQSDLAKEKDICKELLYDNGFSVPRGRLVTSLDHALEIADYFGYPVVVKPVDGHHGKGVIVNLKTPEDLKEAYEKASEYSNNIMLEEYIDGDDFRFLLINNKVVGVARRVPAHVMGDGKSNIEELVEEANKDPKRGRGHRSILTKMNLGEEEIMCLHRQGLEVDSVPKEGEMIYLRETANISTGGTAENYTDFVHPTIKRAVERASKLLSMDVMGVDLIAEDVTLPANQTRWGIIEINSSPGLRMHLYPSHGEPIPVGKYIVDSMYSEGNGRIPLVAVTGTNGKTTTSRLIEWIARNQGYHTGMAVTGGIWSGGDLVKDGDTTGPWSANVVLQDPEVEYAVLETARGGIVKRGLGFDKCSVSVVTNIREDHIGLNGIEDIEDIFWIKSLLTEVTDEEGYSVINANDEFAERLMKKSNGTPLLFSVKRNELIEKHMEAGGKTFFYEDGFIWAKVNGGLSKVADVYEIPYLMGGVEMLVENTLAAMAAAFATGIPIKKIIHALETFRMNEEMNPGRLNVFEVEQIPVILDYAHNRDAIRALGEYTSHFNARTKYLVFAGVGDRSDDALTECGIEAAEWFDKIIITDNEEMRRGRKEGEILQLLKMGVDKSRKEPIVIDDMERAVTYAIKSADKEDIVVIADLDIDTEYLENIVENMKQEQLIRLEVPSKEQKEVSEKIFN